MTMPDPITPDDIAEAAASPASATEGSRSATAHSIPDQIAAATFKATEDALSGGNENGGAKSGWARLRPARAIPPGAV
jgi:hypothetical protein